MADGVIPTPVRAFPTSASKAQKIAPPSVLGPRPEDGQVSHLLLSRFAESSRFGESTYSLATGQPLVIQRVTRAHN